MLNIGVASATGSAKVTSRPRLSNAVNANAQNLIVKRRSHVVWLLAVKWQQFSSLSCLKLCLIDWTERTVPVHLRTIPITAFDITQNPPTPSKHPKAGALCKLWKFQSSPTFCSCDRRWYQSELPNSPILAGGHSDATWRSHSGTWKVWRLVSKYFNICKRHEWSNCLQLYSFSLFEESAATSSSIPCWDGLMMFWTGWSCRWGKPVGCSSAWPLWHQEIWMYHIWLLHGRPCCRASWNKQRWILCGSSERKVKDTTTTHHLSEKVTGKLGAWHEPNRKRYMMAPQALRHVPFAYSFQHISILILILRCGVLEMVMHLAFLQSQKLFPACIFFWKAFDFSGTSISFLTIQEWPAWRSFYCSPKRRVCLTHLTPFLHGSKIFWPGHLGQLTSLGYRQCRGAGHELRRRYPGAQIRAFSTETWEKELGKLRL